MQMPFTHHTLTCAFVLFSCLFLPVAGSFAQTTDTTVYVVVEHQPEFPGGFEAIRAYLKTNVLYPPEAQKAGIKGRVIVSFVVEIDSSTTKVQLLKGLGYGCDDEALRVVSAMPRWRPGSQSGKPIRVKYNLPVLFGIDYPPVKVR